ncbi:MAG TPA: hypothetical protein VMS43_16125 [Allosphingosinicella sp.]|nr:hypothetical protein [Allosphingosinicella sp.]
MLTALLFAALQAAAPAPQSPPEPAGARAGRAWGDCVKARIDARMRADVAPNALVTEAFAQCAAEEEAIRAAIAAERGEEVARLNVERIRSGGRQLFLAYIERARGQSADQPS